MGGGEEGRAHAVLRELAASDGALAVGGPVLGVPKRFYAPGTLTAALDGQEAGGCQPAARRTLQNYSAEQLKAQLVGLQRLWNDSKGKKKRRLTLRMVRYS